MTSALDYLNARNAEHRTVIASHSGSFHADDLFGVAVLRLLSPSSLVIRTRDLHELAAADFRVDVGGQWDPATGDFDHHQKGFSGARPDGTGYASAGLVWAAYGQAYVKLLHPELDDDIAQAVADRIDQELMIFIDRVDTGADSVAPGLFGISAMLAQFVPSGRETKGMGADQRDDVYDEKFLLACDLVGQMLRNAVRGAVEKALSAQYVRESDRLMDGRVLLLAESGLMWEDTVCAEMPEVLFVVYPNSDERAYHVHVVPKEPQSFKARKDLPEAWAGLRDKALAEASGVPDAYFCHTGRFICGCLSKDGALKLATLATVA